MAAGSPDLVDCTRLAEEKAVLRRDYELKELPRIRDLLAEPTGVLHASFAFAKQPTGLPGAKVEIEAMAPLLCQRCLQGFGYRVQAGSDVEFSASASADPESEREFYVTQDGQVSLKDLAEEELLLALPIAPACDAPLTCGNAPGYVTGDEDVDEGGGKRRPFSVLQDLLKKT
jgi:uncharacterized protein